MWYAQGRYGYFEMQTGDFLLLGEEITEDEAWEIYGEYGEIIPYLEPWPDDECTDESWFAICTADLLSVPMNPGLLSNI